MIYCSFITPFLQTRMKLYFTLQGTEVKITPPFNNSALVTRFKSINFKIFQSQRLLPDPQVRNQYQ